MSTKKVKRYPNAVKAKVAMAAIREDKTIAQIGSEYEINPCNVKIWKKQLLDNIEVVFDRESQVKDYKELLKKAESKRDELHRQIGELSVQLSWAKKKATDAGLLWETSLD
jgi:transposase